MKTIKTKISVVILILAFSIGGQVQAKELSISSDKKETVHIKIHAPLLKLIAEALDLDGSDFLAIHEQLEEVEALTLSFGGQKLNFVFDEESLDFMGMYEEYKSEQLEDWMFEELVQPEEDLALEDWMFDTEYFDDKAVIEDWMLDTEYYNKQS